MVEPRAFLDLIGQRTGKSIVVVRTSADFAYSYSDEGSHALRDVQLWLQNEKVFCQPWRLDSTLFQSAQAVTNGPTALRL